MSAGLCPMPTSLRSCSRSFVVMFAASNSDQKKAGQVAQAVQVAFKEMAVFTPTGKVVPLYDAGGLPSDTNSVIGNTHSAL